MSLTDDGLLYERIHPAFEDASPSDRGVQRVYCWGRYGLSAINGKTFHSFPFAWEIAVLRFDGNTHHIIYDTPLTSDVEIFGTDYEANEFINKAKLYFTQAREAKES